MDTNSEAHRRARKRYLETERGKAIQLAAEEKYRNSPEGKEARRRAAQKYELEHAEERREYKRLKAREYYAARKNRENQNQSE